MFAESLKKILPHLWWNTDIRHEVPAKNLFITMLPLLRGRQYGKNYEGQQRGDNRNPQQSGTDGHTKRGGQPQTGSGGQTFDFLLIGQFEDRAGPYESNAGRDSLEYTARIRSRHTGFQWGDHK